MAHIFWLIGMVLQAVAIALMCMPVIDWHLITGILWFALISFSAERWLTTPGGNND